MKKYQIIYADPPWSFNFQKRNGLSEEAKSKLYPTMKAEDIIRLPVKDLSEDNCILFLWVMNSEIPLALKCIEAWENSSVEAWENSSVEAWENSSVVARGNSSVVARENSSVVAWEKSVIRIFRAVKSIILHGFSVCFKPLDLTFKITQKSKYTHIQNIKNLGWFENNGVEKKASVILYKKVSKDFKTQENTKNETLWKIGSTVEHKEWNPTLKECGAGKFHACSRPYFCDEFRNEQGDRYIAVKISLKDLHEWKNNPSYPHKIGFRKGKVLFECDRFGKQIDKKANKHNHGKLRTYVHHFGDRNF